MNWRARALILASLAVTSGVSFVQWRVTTPGYLTDREWHSILLVGAVCLIIVLSAQWVTSGADPFDPDRDRYTQSDNRR